jgi:hypothetical protein
MKKTLIVAIGVLTLGSASIASAGEGGFFDRLGNRLDRRLDRQGDRINDRLDRRGGAINDRLDAASKRAEANGKYKLAEHLDRKGDRIATHLDRKGDRIERRKDRRGDRINRRLNHKVRFHHRDS